MALYPLALRPYNNKILRNCIFTLTKIQFSNGIVFSNCIVKNLHVDVDIIDEFTTHLIQSKSKKWAKRKWKIPQMCRNTSVSGINKNKLCDNQLEDVEFLSRNEINAILENYIQNENYDSLICLTKECMKHKFFPKLSVLNIVLSYCSQRGEKDTIIQFLNLYDELKLTLPEISGREYFTYFLAGAVWIKGDIKKSLTLFEEVYKKHSYLRRKLKLNLRILISETFTTRSEAVLKIIVDFCETLHKDYNDSYLLCCVWQHCFLSEWFSDQSLAIEILERNKTLCDALGSRISYVIVISLQNDRLEVVHRLLEYLLKNGKKSEASGLLIALFDYYLKQKNLQCCSTILQWCRDNDVHMPCIHSTKFINLLIKHGLTSEVSVKPEGTRLPKYSFKF